MIFRRSSCSTVQNLANTVPRMCESWMPSIDNFQSNYCSQRLIHEACYHSFSDNSHLIGFSLRVGYLYHLQNVAVVAAGTHPDSFQVGSSSFVYAAVDEDILFRTSERIGGKSVPFHHFLEREQSPGFIIQVLATVGHNFHSSTVTGESVPIFGWRILLHKRRILHLESEAVIMVAVVLHLLGMTAHKKQRQHPCRHCPENISHIWLIPILITTFAPYLQILRGPLTQSENITSLIITFQTARRKRPASLPPQLFFAVLPYLQAMQRLRCETCL